MVNPPLIGQRSTLTLNSLARLMRVSRGQHNAFLSPAFSVKTSRSPKKRRHSG
jgi:hypothetical protein